MSTGKNQKSISEDEVSDCISEKVDEGWSRERAVAACLSMAEEGSSSPEKNVEGVDFLSFYLDCTREQVVKAVEDVDTTPTQEMADIASEVLEKIDDSDFDNDDCGTRTGLERANQLENREELSADTVGRMVSFFARHDGNQEVDDDVDSKWEDCGYVAWQLWGGDAGRTWAENKMEEIEEAEEDEDKDSKQADYNFEVGDWVSWEFGDGTSQGQVTDRENEPGESLSAQGNEREATEDEPVYKMSEWDEEEQDLTNDVVKSESELSSIQKPEEASKNKVDTMNSEELEEQKDIINENQEEMRHKSFKVKGEDVEVVKNETDGAPVVNVPIQALSEDRDGDLINEKGQESIIRQLKSGKVPLVPNHGVGEGEAMYDFTDIFGQFVDGENRNGTTIGTARMREGNKMAEELVDLLEQDMPVGFSVGFIPTEKEPREKEGEGDGMEISDLDLMEVSAVGIPSNPDAVPQAMGSAVAMAKNAGLEKQEIVSTIEKAFNDTMTEKQEQSEKTDSNTDSKSDEKTLKQMTSEDVEMAMEVIFSKVSEHMGMAMDEAEDEIMGMLDEEEETDEMDEDEDEDMEEDGEHSDEEDEEEMSGEPEEQDSDDSSGHSEDDKSSEPAESNSEKKTGDVPNTAEKNNSTEGKELKTIDNSEDSEEKSEEKETVEEDPFAVRTL